MYRSTPERALLLNVPLRVGAHGGMWVCFFHVCRSSGHQRLGGGCSAKRPTGKHGLSYNLGPFEMHDTGEKPKRGIISLIPSKPFLVQCLQFVALTFIVSFSFFFFLCPNQPNDPVRSTHCLHVIRIKRVCMPRKPFCCQGK